MRANGWSLVELLVVVAIIAILVSMLVPSLHAARRQAQLAACGARLRGIHTALVGYAADNRLYLPPFAFSDHDGCLPLSGHWGGASDPADPTAFGRTNVQSVNLRPLVDTARLNADALLCPGEPAEVRRGTTGYFPYTSRFSSYGLRFPPSGQLFHNAPGLSGYGGSMLGVYRFRGGGGPATVGMNVYTVPLVRTDMRYPIDGSVGVAGAVYHFPTSVILADGFWRQEFSAAAAAGTPPKRAVRMAWLHGDAFNTLSGDGAVSAVRDDGTVAANSAPPGEASLPDDGIHHATYVERIWRYFENAR